MYVLTKAMSDKSKKRRSLPSFRPSVKMVGGCKLVHRVNPSHSFDESFYKLGKWELILRTDAFLTFLHTSTIICTNISGSQWNYAMVIFPLGTNHFFGVLLVNVSSLHAFIIREFWYHFAICTNTIYSFCDQTVPIPYIRSSNNFAIKVGLLKKLSN